MATLDENKRIWETGYDWSRGGEEWSVPWGSAEAQWWHTLWPRIHRFLPAPTVLEIAPGFGRWTHYLRKLCERIIVVDLSAKCIEACRQRFVDSTHVEYHVTDGRSLEMISDGSVDFVFSFDSLVHAGKDVLAAYVNQLSRKLSKNGIGFIHHSHCGAFVAEIASGRLNNDSFRDETMTADVFIQLAEQSGLAVISQEILAWGADQRLLSDVLSIFTVKGSPWERPNRISINRDFMQEARAARIIAELYHQ